MKAPAAPESDRRFAWLRRVPVAGWVIAAVALGHGLFFWLVEDAHFTPKVGPYSPPPPAANFGARRTTSVDPQTGETRTETLFVVSTELASPAPAKTEAKP